MSLLAGWCFCSAASTQAFLPSQGLSIILIPRLLLDELLGRRGSRLTQPLTQWHCLTKLNLRHQQQENQHYDQNYHHMLSSSPWWHGTSPPLSPRGIYKTILQQCGSLEHRFRKGLWTAEMQKGNSICQAGPCHYGSGLG